MLGKCKECPNIQEVSKNLLIAIMAEVAGRGRKSMPQKQKKVLYNIKKPWFGIKIINVGES